MMLFKLLQTICEFVIGGSVKILWTIGPYITLAMGAGQILYGGIHRSPFHLLIGASVTTCGVRSLIPGKRLAGTSTPVQDDNLSAGI